MKYLFLFIFCFLLIYPVSANNISTNETSEIECAEISEDSCLFIISRLNHTIEEKNQEISKLKLYFAIYTITMIFVILGLWAYNKKVTD